MNYKELGIKEIKELFNYLTNILFRVYKYILKEIS